MKKQVGLLLGSFIFICILIETSITVSAEEPDLQAQITILNQKINALEQRVSTLETNINLVSKGNYTLIKDFVLSCARNDSNPFRTRYLDIFTSKLVS